VRGSRLSEDVRTMGKVPVRDMKGDAVVGTPDNADGVFEWYDVDENENELTRM
jgi:hypothetical protein